jgi:radical SAM protein with 4Fe4S-binding SPASM domain
VPNAAPPLPRFLQVEVTSACNLRCHMCAVRYRPIVNKADGAMPFDRFVALLDAVPELDQVVLQGLGEPLLAPSIVEMVRFAKDRGADVGFNCNGTLLTTTMAERLVDAGLDWLALSLDGATAETYESIRDGASFERVVAGIRRIVAARASRGLDRPRLRLVFVAMRRNVAELPALVRLAAELGVERVCVQNLSHDFTDTDPAGRYAGIRAFVGTEALWNGGSPAAAGAFAEARAVAAEVGVRLDLPRMEPPVDEPRADGAPGCSWPWTGAYVTANGTVQPCCMVMGDERVSLGSIEDESFAELWRGRGYQEFRDALAGAEPPVVCRGCSLYRGVF